MNETLLKLKNNLEIALNHFNFAEEDKYIDLAIIEVNLAEKNLNDFFKKMKKNG